MDISINDLVRYLDGELYFYEETIPVKKIVGSDDRPQKGALYFLLEYRSNQERLIKQLQKAKVSGVVIKKEYEYNINQFIDHNIMVVMVDHISTAYLEAAEYYRQLFKLPIIEVTGSAGKTTVKEMIGCVLNEHYTALVGEENYNAPSGVAYNLFHLDTNHQVAVLEAGMKDLGIIDLSSSLIKPQIGVITCIQRAHFTQLGSEERILRAKCEMLEHIEKNGSLILNGDDEWLKAIKTSDFNGTIYRVGFDESNDCYATNVAYQNQKATFTVHYQGKKIPFELNTFGEYNIRNALIAIMVGLILNIPIEKIQLGISRFYPVHRRQEVIKRSKGNVIINDNFNANPESTIQLIKELPTIKGDKKLLLLLGDIERPYHDDESYAKRVHYNIGQAIANIDFDYLIAVGKWSKQYINACIEKGINDDKLYYYKSVGKAKGIIKELVSKDYLIVCKAQKAYIDLKPLYKEVK